MTSTTVRMSLRPRPILITFEVKCLKTNKVYKASVNQLKRIPGVPEFLKFNRDFTDSYRKPSESHRRIQPRANYHFRGVKRSSLLA